VSTPTFYNTPDGTSDESASVTPTLQAVLPGASCAAQGTGGIVPQYFHREASQRYTDLFRGPSAVKSTWDPSQRFGGFGGGRYRQRFTLEIDDRLLRHEKRDVAGARCTSAIA